MSRDTKRETRAPGIYRDATGHEVQVCVGGVRQARRFPRTLALADLKAERERMRVALRTAQARAARAAPASGTLAADAPVYLAAVAGMPSIAERTAHIDHWVEHLGDVPRDALTAVQIRTVLQHWLTAPRVGRGGRALPPYAVETVRHHLKALRHLYTTLDGRGARNPARDVPMPKAPPLAPRRLPIPAVLAILRQFAETSKTRARLEVIVTTGMSHGEVKRLRPEHVQLEAGVVVALGRRKGQGTAARAIPLTRFSRRAFRRFARLEAWGWFSNSSMHSRFRDACERAGYGATDWRPYDLRHTFASEVAQASGDERAVMALLGQTSTATTRRYTLGSVDPRVQAAIASLARKRR
jgi:integrase